MYDYEQLYRKLVNRYGNQNGLHEQMRQLNSQVESLSYDEYFSTMKSICKNNMGAYHLYFDKYQAWYEKIGIKIIPKGQ